MSNHTPQRPNQKIRRPANGFTLIELLMVFAVIAILAAITFGISQGVQNAQNKAKAQVELAAISQALEQYKSRYGDFPRHDSDSGEYTTAQFYSDGAKAENIDVTSVMLLYALTGRLKFDPSNQEDSVFKVADDLDDEEVEKAPKFIDLEKFSYTVDAQGNPGALLDPWGNPYIYWYKWENTPGDWDVFGYHLYSTGPKGEEANDAIKEEIPNKTTGILNDDFREVADAEGIIFAGE
jgi:prepilin-type N-terminal cleavage/methylation domain-containing protein